MSFVGPRPLLPVDQPIDSKSRLLVRPGLTGWAQIKGGRQISPADKAALDVWYVGNMSLTLDLKIMLETVPMLIFGERVTETAIVHARRDMQPAARIPERHDSTRDQLILPISSSWPKSELRMRSDGQNRNLLDCISGHTKLRVAAAHANAMAIKTAAAKGKTHIP